jgi:hypothetical protein
MTRPLAAVLLCLSLFGLGACVAPGSVVEVHTKVFTRLTEAPSGRKFAVLAADAEVNKDLEFMTHAARTSIYLKEFGNRMIKPGERPDFIVYLSYSVAQAGRGYYRRELQMTILDRSEQRTPGTDVPLYQGNALSLGSSASSAKIMPILIDGLMRGFPGKPGQTDEYTYPSDFVERVYRLNDPASAR